ncbi:hypothetical protein ACIQPP_05435 [Streptomyces violaceusniger]|uniref:hypothetical protein n=1 Tax=Streptomyces violaceusniger TaxID=68280 RepID=UPI0009C1DF26|nr:hypothetical protein [Streptomyces hygroscopicus]AQW55263.1 hypothetical protein SHXM_08726 [Streptomyces hygroscopicus]
MTEKLHRRARVEHALRTTLRGDCRDWPMPAGREACQQPGGHKYDMRCALCTRDVDALVDAVLAAAGEDDTTASAAPGPTRWAYDQACEALHKHRQRAEALTVALDSVRAWRHRQPLTAATRYDELDAVLDAAAAGQIEAQLAAPEPTSLPEAVEAHHRVMSARRRALADARRIWDQIEATAIRNVARFMPVRSEAVR